MRSKRASCLIGTKLRLGQSLVTDGRNDLACIFPNAVYVRLRSRRSPQPKVRPYARRRARMRREIPEQNRAVNLP
jgi:hypothetical protein